MEEMREHTSILGRLDSLTRAPMSRVEFGVMALLQHSLALAPVLTLTTVYLLSWRIQAVIGHWPRVWLDDPKFAAPGDWLTDLLYSAVIPWLMWSIVAVPVLPLLTWLLWRKYPRWWSLLLLVVFLIGLFLLRFDPGRRVTWYND